MVKHIAWDVELVRKFVEENGNGDVLISNKYTNSNTKLIYKCHECNVEYSIDWNSFIKGYRHYMCANNFDRGKGRRTQYAEVKQYYENNGYQLLSDDYKNQAKKLETTCPNGHLYMSRFSDFKQGYRCGICSHIQKSKNQTFTFEYVSNYIIKNGNGDVLVSDEYTKSKEKIKILCHNCKKEYAATFDGFKRGKRCRICSYVQRGENKANKLQKEGHNLAEENPDLLLEWDWNKNTIDPYKICSNSKAHAFWLCQKCGKSYKSNIGSRAGKSKSGCPFCKQSKGELKVSKYLEVHKVNYIPQYTLKGCKYKKLLPFDFYLTDYNMCLEYLGAQHFYPIEYFGGEKVFEIQQIRDKIKEDYCGKHSIPLIKIPYWDFDNIELILTKELNL